MSVKRNMSGVAAHNAEQNLMIRRSLSEALQILMKQKDCASISVSELCKKAGVSRTAFYNNFSTISEVFEEVSRSFIKEINEKISPWQTKNSLSWYENLSEEEKFRRLVFNGAIQNVAFRWLEEGRKESAEQIAAQCYSVIEGNLR